MLRIAICDDDLNFLEDFVQMITQAFLARGEEIKVRTFSDGKDLIRKVEKDKEIFDIIFLDVEMPLVHGFQVAERLRELNRAFVLIFTTYMEHQSQKGYLYGAFRYVFKNNLEAEISEAVESLMKKLGHAARDQTEITFKCRISGVIENITLKKADIVFLKAEKTRRVTLTTIYTEYELLVKPLSQYAELLNSSAFVLIMRHILLNFNHIERIEGDVFVLTGGAMVPLGIKREVRKASMEKYLTFLEERI